MPIIGGSLDIYKYTVLFYDFLPTDFFIIRISKESTLPHQSCCSNRQNVKAIAIATTNRSNSNLINFHAQSQVWLTVGVTGIEY